MRRLVPSRQFRRFCVVGAVGFVVDAGVLTALLSAHLADPVRGRLFSFAAAVCVTFALNRRWTFDDRQASIGRQMARYLGVQGLGFLFNLAVYALLFASLPPPLDAPLFCIGVASVAALALNFLGNRFVVFRRKVSAQPARDHAL